MMIKFLTLPRQNLIIHLFSKIKVDEDSRQQAVCTLHTLTSVDVARDRESDSAVKGRKRVEKTITKESRGVLA